MNDPFVEQAIAALTRSIPFQIAVEGEPRPGANAAARRTPDLGIAIEVVSPAWRQDLRETHEIGDVRPSTTAR